MTKKRQNPTDEAETAGINYATAQLESEYFMDWVRDQLAEAADMDPGEVLPLETKQDARVIAKNMLQQLEWDTKRDLKETKEFFAGFHRGVTNPSTVDWLADELLELKGQMRGGGVREAASARKGKPWPDWLILSSIERGEALAPLSKERAFELIDLGYIDATSTWKLTPKGEQLLDQHEKETGSRTLRHSRVRDYIAVDRRDRPVGPRHKGYSDAKRDADNAGGTVKFVPSTAREMRRPKSARSARRRR